MKTLSVVLLFSIYSISVHSQSSLDTKNNTQFGYGFLSDLEMINVTNNTTKWFYSSFLGSTFTSEYKTSGPVLLSSTFFIKDRISLGPEFNYVKVNTKNIYSTGETTTEVAKYYSLSCRFSYHYLKHESLQIYSGASLGGSLKSSTFKEGSSEVQKKNGLQMAYQINAFGLRFGSEIALFAEFGFGRNGIINFGIATDFRKN